MVVFALDGEDVKFHSEDDQVFVELFGPKELTRLLSAVTVIDPLLTHH